MDSAPSSAPTRTPDQGAAGHLHEVAARHKEGDVAVPRGDHLTADNARPAVISRRVYPVAPVTKASI